jgi:hypothetical protein
MSGIPQQPPPRPSRPWDYDTSSFLFFVVTDLLFQARNQASKQSSKQSFSFEMEET